MPIFGGPDMINKGFMPALALALAGLLTHTPVFASDLVIAGVDTTPAESPNKARLIDLWQPGDSGQRMNIRGRVTGPDGAPLAGIEVSVRQPDGDGDWNQQYSTTLKTDAQGRYQFGSVVPKSRYCGEPVVSVSVYQNGWEYFDTDLVFSENHDTSLYYGDGEQVFLEESTVGDETIMFGRYDITLSPE
jgi:protocatechuate 3,4-dioxygenase beta subunit